ncbi:MAG: flagellar hook-length control protein FliK, partial [Sulfurimonadaceae bacterium]|nr:flagellar hook-length control protein FliK [Sulfurimonadaceae bacterium]
MILMDLQADKSKLSLSQLLLGKHDGKNSDTFAKLLQELSLAIKEGKGDPQKTFMLLNAGEDGMLPANIELLKEGTKESTKETGILELLKGSDAEEAVDTEIKPSATKLTASELKDLKLLHGNIDRNVEPKQLRTLIHDAKSYLKSQIAEVVQPKKMPNTLRGLVQLAEKVGIDVSKITIEEVQSKQTPALLEKRAPAKQPLILPQAERPAPVNVKPQEHTTEELVNTKTSEKPQKTVQQPKNDTPTPLKSLLQDDGAEPAQAKTKTAQNAQTDDLPVADEPVMKTQQSKAAPVQEKVQASKSETVTKETPVVQAKTDTAPETQTTKTEKPAASAVTQTKAQSGNSGNMPQQNAATQVAAASEQTPESVQASKPLFDTTLSQLLQGEEEVRPMTQESELRPQDVTTEKKTSQPVTAAMQKENLEVKINEAKQMVRHLVGEIKEAVQNYKPPFTRIKIQLNPVKLGEVDVTMVQRGNNVHINISSNTAAVTTLAQNATELRTQLSQSGMGNATMNFSSNA